MRIQGGHTAMDAPLNQGLVKDIAAGQASGRFVLPSLEAGVLLVMGSGQIALARLQELTPAGHEVRVHLTLTDDHPWAQAFVILEALPLDQGTAAA